MILNLEKIANVIRIFVEAPDWDAAQALVESQPDVFLDPLADFILRQAMASLDDADLINQLRISQEVLVWCRAEGIETAFERIKSISTLEFAGPPDAPADLQAIVDAIQAFTNSDDWADAETILHERADELLDPLAVSVLEHIITGLAPNSDGALISTLRAHQLVLRWCQEIGSEAALALAKGVLGEQDKSPEDSADLQTHLLDLFMTHGAAKFRRVLEQAGIPRTQIDALLRGLRHSGDEN